jgi:nucleoside-diphosphate-sugar epimerase
MPVPERQRVLITGATGFIGRPTVECLRAAGFEVHAFTRSTANLEGGHAHVVDVLDRDAVTESIAALRPSHLMHLAWDVSDTEGPQHLSWVQASLHLLEQFQKNGGRRAVVAGTCFEYDASYGFCTEGLTPIRPDTFYGQAKASLSALAQAYGESTGLSVATARIFFVYGPHQPSQKLIPDVIESLLAAETAECTHGQQVRDYLHVTDVAEACVALLESSVEGPVNVGSGVPTRLQEMIYTVADAIGARSRVALGARPAPSDEAPLLVANPARLREEVGWRPSYTIREGLQDTVEWWRAAPSRSMASS